MSIYNTDETVELLKNTKTYNTIYGKITLLKNEGFIGKWFEKGDYWDIGTMLKLKKYINPNCNILEIGGHCGTSSVVYSSFLNSNYKVFVYEPQQNMYKLLCHNINQNNFNDKIIPFNKGVFCYEGIGKMNGTDVDGGGGNVEKRYTTESSDCCNFGGIGLGNDGESITLTTIDNMGLENIGFIHCDAQGSETFIFSKGLETIRRDRPFILYENNVDYSKFYYDNVCNSYPEYREDGLFDIKKFCIEELKYWGFTDRYNGEIDTLLIP